QEGRTERSIAAKKPESEVIITEIGESKKVGEEHPFLKKSRSAAPDKSRLKPAETPADALSASANDNAGQPAGAVAERIPSDDVETVSNTRKFNMGQPRKANYIESDTAEVNMPEDEKRKPAETPAEQIPLVEVNEYIGIPSMPIRYKYNKPPVELYKDNPQKLAAGDDNIEERCAIIEKTLDNFGVPAQVENVVSGPTITRYEISIPEGISVNKVPPRASDLAMRLAVESVRIEAPIPGKNLIGIEVPNKVKQMVGMKELLLEKAYQKSSPEALSIVLGEDVVGNPIITDLTKTPHLLVAGATGMGKSVFLNALIMSLITKYGPNDLRLILVDPKQVEFTIYENIPHLLVNKILTEASECIAMLDWAIDEMELRYKIFRTCYAQKIEEYNNSIDTKIKRKMPKIVIIIDELGDLFSMSAQIKHDIEDRIKRLTQKARAAGIHVVVATQRPDVTVITGVIKTNLPSRIAFKVLNYEDSRTILSDGGAEKLLGNGDMIFKTSTSALLLRIQGAYVSKDEIVRVLNYIKSNNQCYYDDNAKKYLDAKKASTQNGGYAASATFGDGEGESGQSAKTFNNIPIRNIKALKAVIERKQASISLLQRCLSVGYATAGKMIDWMESMKYVTPFDGSKAR
ncbi:MAG: DNA translocase FtsK, partial [Clostridia bacterium]|nr:DNA translocase FtsK [Clostridia bacterium]